MNTTARLVRNAGLAAVLAFAGAAMAQTMAKEGNVDTTSCWSGTNSVIAFSKTHSALSIEFSGTTRSNVPGGAFDMTTFRCVGMLSAVDGPPAGTVVCESVDKDGDKWMSRYVGEGSKYKGEALAGTGKYEGMIFSSNTVNYGPFPVIKVGTFQNCNRQTGTYKLR